MCLICIMYLYISLALHYTVKMPIRTRFHSTFVFITTACSIGTVQRPTYCPTSGVQHPSPSICQCQHLGQLLPIQCPLPTLMTGALCCAAFYFAFCPEPGPATCLISSGVWSLPCSILHASYLALQHLLQRPYSGSFLASCSILMSSTLSSQYSV